MKTEISPLKWAGGKRRLLPMLRPLLAPYLNDDDSRILVEPFCGSGAVSFGLAPLCAHLNDINRPLINFFEHMQRGLTIEPNLMRVDSRVCEAKVNRNCPCHFCLCRRRFNELNQNGGANSVEAARLFYFLNKAAFNGLYRTNRRGEFNTPIGRYPELSYCADLGMFRCLAAGWTFTCGDFEEVEVRPTDIIYADPPFDVEFREYASGGFGWSEQERLVRWLLRHPGPTVVSGQATERTLALYRDAGFNLATRKAARAINSDASKRKVPAVEMVATRNLG